MRRAARSAISRVIPLINRLTPTIVAIAHAALDGQRRREARLLTALLRIAEKLESEHEQHVAAVDVQIAGRKAIFNVRSAEGAFVTAIARRRSNQLRFRTSASDAVDGSSTGTSVPWMWALLRLP